MAREEESQILRVAGSSPAAVTSYAKRGRAADSDIREKEEVNALPTDGGCATAAGRFNSGPSRQRGNLILQLPGAVYPGMNHFLKHGSRKDGTVPAEGQLPERRDGLRIMRLVMSINILLISY